MKALSIKQPWAYLIAAGHKDVENRSWSTNYRGRIYIHASKTQDAACGFRSAYTTLLAQYGRQRADSIWEAYWKSGPLVEGAFANERVPVFGGIIGEVDIVDCVTKSDSPWFEGPYGFVLANAVMYDKPIPYRGQQGFFEIPTIARPAP